MCPSIPVCSERLVGNTDAEHFRSPLDRRYARNFGLEVRTRPQEKNGPTMTTQAPVRKLRPLNAPAPASASDAIFNYFQGIWVDLDGRRRPKSVPQLAGWATPTGWLEGSRPSCAHEQKSAGRTAAGNCGNGQHNSHSATADSDLLREIERMEKALGKRMYRGLLKSLARVWNAKDIQDRDVQEKVLAHMQAAERGFRRAQAARDKAGAASFAGILGSLKLRSLDQVDNLKTLQEIVAALEVAAAQGK